MMGNLSLAEEGKTINDNKNWYNEEFSLIQRKKKTLKLKLLLEAVESKQELTLNLAVLAIVVLLQSPIGNPHMHGTSWIF